MEPTHFEALYPKDARFGTIEELFSFIKSGKSCQLIGLPGVGRANIFGLLAYNRAVREAHVGENQKWFHFVPVDFSEVRGKPLFEATKLIFLELTDSLRERKFTAESETVSNIFKEALSFQDELVLFQGLKKAIDYLAIEKELTIVFLFDRFEEYLPTLTQDFFSNLRVLRNRAKYRFSVVFSLGRPLEESIEPLLLSDFYEFVLGNHVFVPLEDDPSARFRLSHLEKVSGKTVSENTYREILSLTGGHGKLTRLASELSLDARATPEVESLLSHKSIQGAILEIMYYLTPQELEIIRNGQTTNFLEKIGLIQEGHPTIPLFWEFMKTNKFLLQDKIIYDSVTNTIKRGNIILSDILTASEFRFLLLLLEHEGEVVERETIIQNVWKNFATTQGVSDQALDQLVMRLRKKIETDPNNPQHIQTIKGRGVKFVQ